MRKSEKVLKIEKEYEMDIRDILIQKYYDECKSLRQIGKELNYDNGNLSRMFSKLEIPKRHGTEAFKNWWDNTDDEGKRSFVENSKKSVKRMQTKECRDKLRATMQTEEYKNKMSKINSGKRNGMYKEELTEEHRIDKRGIFGYKKWSKDVRKRDDCTCQICGKKHSKMIAHHLESYDTNIELRLDLNNGITLCQSCHNEFHNKHRNEKTNTKQFLQFKEDKQRS